MSDALISEVRKLRHEVVGLAGGNIDELASKLREIEREFNARSGQFAAIPRQPLPDLFPNIDKSPPNFVVDDVRSRT